jgi:hypothetical protein
LDSFNVDKSESLGMFSAIRGAREPKVSSGEMFSLNWPSLERKRKIIVRDRSVLEFV